MQCNASHRIASPAHEASPWRHGLTSATHTPTHSHTPALPMAIRNTALAEHVLGIAVPYRCRERLTHVHASMYPSMQYVLDLVLNMAADAPGPQSRPAWGILPVASSSFVLCLRSQHPPSDLVGPSRGLRRDTDSLLAPLDRRQYIVFTWQGK